MIHNHRAAVFAAKSVTALPALLIGGAIVLIPLAAIGTLGVIVVVALLVGSLLPAFVGGFVRGYRQSVARRPLPPGIRRVQ